MIAGVILAGGAGTRIGGDKALVPFRGRTLIEAVIGRVQDQVGELALSVPIARVDAYRARLGMRFALLADSLPGDTGPLAGVVRGLEWARGTAKWLATFPCDTPFLPDDLVAQLMRDAPEAPVAARSEGRMHGVCAVWPVSCLERLRAGVVEEHWRSLHGALDHLGGTIRDIACESEAFFNVNTPEDLARAEALAHDAV
ncbi:MAG: molybdenum cofactor guanylyltransferase MobA [Rhizomicrobium sp.]